MSNLTEYINLIKSGVNEFEGSKKYIATGSLETQFIKDYEIVDYTSRPSRANMEFEKNDIIFAKMMDTEKVFLIDEDSSDNIYSTGFAGLRIKDLSKIHPKYVFFWLRSFDFQNEKNKRCTGATQKAITNNNIKKIKFPLIPYENQLNLIKTLDQLDEIIQYRNKSIRYSIYYLNSLFEKMFLDQEFKIELLKNNTTLITSGSTPKGGNKNYSKTGDILFIRSQNVLMNEFSDHESLYISNDIHNTMKRTWLKTNDVLLNITGASIGRTVVYNGPSDKANLNQHVCIIRLKDLNKINPIFLNYYLSSKIIQKHIKQINDGATREALNFTQIGNFEIIIPPIELQNKFSQTVKQMEKIKQWQLNSQKELIKLFNNIIQNAFKGGV